VKKRLRTALAAAAALASVLAALAAYQAYADGRDHRAFPPPGQLYDAGGPWLHLYCTGSGTPAAVLIHGGLGLYTDWGLVQPEVAKLTTPTARHRTGAPAAALVCSFDRAGRGHSLDGPLPRTGERIAGEMHAAFASAGLAPPYVLAGHSIGGLFARSYARRFPAEVAGLVLVDAAHEDTPPRVWEALRSRCAVARALAPLGILRLTHLFGDVPGLPPRPQAEAGALLNQTRFVGAACDELNAIDETAADVRNAPPLGDLPLVVLTAGIFEPPPGLPAEEKPALEKLWNEQQDALARLSSPASHRVAHKSRHTIALFEPEVVVDAIREIISRARP
jgi:pimeloyl-ACP methyl ester carboxylesterase